MSAAQMLFLPYTPRDDAASRGYEEWLRTIDNPFFNSRPGIRHYSNWKVAGGLASFTHFDFLLLEAGTTADDVWADAALVDFAAQWVRQWGAVPNAADPSDNYHCHVAVCTGGESGPFGGQVAIDPSGQDGERWEFTQSVAGIPPWPGFARRFGAPDPMSPHLISGELIAAPGYRPS